MTSLRDIPTQLGWTFTHVLPGTFKRDKADFAHLDNPILAPLPHAKASTVPLEGSDAVGPFIYFVVDDAGRLGYIGKCKEKTVIKRWVRPGIGGPASHYWTHSTKGGGTIANIAAGLGEGQGPFHLRFSTLAQLRELFAIKYSVTADMPEAVALKKMEDSLIHDLKPLWNQ